MGLSLGPSAISSVKSILIDSTSFTINGANFIAGSTTVALSQPGKVAPTCSSVNVLSSTSLRCTFGTKPSLGPFYIDAIALFSAQNLITKTYPSQSVQAGTVLYGSLKTNLKMLLLSLSNSSTAPEITTTLTNYSASPLSTWTIEGTNFSSIISENKIILSSGTCDIIEQRSSATALVCAYNPSAIPSGILSAQVVVLDGVSSPMTPIWNFSTISTHLSFFNKQCKTYLPNFSLRVVVGGHFGS